jgi:hypothetical protein
MEYVTDISTILSYGMMGTPALVVKEKVLMTGIPCTANVEQALKKEVAV